MFSLNSGYGQSSLENSKNQVFYLAPYTPPGLHERMNYLIGEWRLSITVASRLLLGVSLFMLGFVKKVRGHQ